MSVNRRGVSVIICCYNSAARLPQTLSYLALQKVPSDIPWEIIMVNNASKDDTASIGALEWATHGNNTVPFKIVDQPKAGLSYAREKGIAEAQFEYIVFCDDDNWLFDDYVAKGFKLLDNSGDIGIIGGHGLPKPEINPPEWFNNYSSYYATGEQNKFNGIMEGSNPYVYGAGSVIRKSVLQRLYKINFEPLAIDRLNEKLSSGGDVELCYAIKLLGYNIAYSNDLKFYHFIPRNRLSDNYLFKLVYQFGYCNIVHRPYYWLFNPELPKFKKTWLWTLLISINIYLLSLLKSFKTTSNSNSFISKVNLKHSRGRLLAILKLNRHIERSYLTLTNKFLEINLLQEKPD